MSRSPFIVGDPGPDQSAPQAEESREFLSSSLLSTRPNPRRRAVSFAISVGAQITFVVVLAGLLTVRPQLMHQVLQEQALYFPHHPPAVVKVKPLPRPVPKAPPPPVRTLEAKLTPPPIERPKVVPQQHPKIIEAPKVAFNDPAPVLKAAPLPPAPPIKLNNLPVATAAPTVHRPAAEVQTGGFGSPDGAPGASHATTGNIARLGTFGMPEGPGQGNGTGGSHGVRGVVDAGFGDPNGVPGGTGHTVGGSVHTGGFGEETAAASPQHAQAAPAHPVTPVEIVYKPDPQYTPEAKQLGIQGEVLLQVVFEPNGQLTIVGVKRGLGHGLDEQAIAAARQIRFKPAMRDGTPIETEAVLHITFQIAD